MVISQQLVQEIQGLRADKVLVFTVDKAFPSLTGVSAEPKGVKRNEQGAEKPNIYFTPKFSLVTRSPATSKKEIKTQECSFIALCHWGDNQANWRD